MAWYMRLGACALLAALTAALLVACDSGGSAPGATVSVTLTVQPGTIALAGQTATADLFDGQFVPPMIRARPGDAIDLTLRNRGAEPTNVHFHGLEVSPLGNSDNIFIDAQPGQDLHYRVQVPATQRPGLFWYHTHEHGLAEEQVFRGMAGAIVIDGVEDRVPQLRGLAQQILLLKDVKLANGAVTLDDAVPYVRTVNGAVNPTLTMAPGEVQFWRIGDLAADSYYLLELEGASFWVLSRDANLLPVMREEQRLLLAPGNRIEVLVRAPAAAGNYALRTLRYQTGPGGDEYPAATLATLQVAGSPRGAPPALPFALPPVPDLRLRPIAAERSFVFDSVTVNGDEVFRINGRPFDANRVDVRVPLGNVERWRIRNTADEEHTFHIHQTPFQVVAINGQEVAFDGYRDNVNIAAGGEVTVIIPFTDPTILGRFVFHCHILEHEDGGMMAVVEVFDPGNRLAAAGRSPYASNPPNDFVCTSSGDRVPTLRQRSMGDTRRAAAG